MLWSCFNTAKRKHPHSRAEKWGCGLVLGQSTWEQGRLGWPNKIQLLLTVGAFIFKHSCKCKKVEGAALHS